MAGRRRKRIFATAAAAVLLAGTVAACTPYELPPLPLEVTIRPSASQATTGTEITFELTAQGGALLGFTIEFGDGASERVPTHGARTARTSVRHTYGFAGTYEASVQVEDARLGNRSASATITIQSPAP